MTAVGILVAAAGHAQPAWAATNKALTPETVPYWNGGPLPYVSLEPSCKKSVKDHDGDFDVGLRRGLSFAYASPITVTAWRSPESACRRLNATTKLRFYRFKWRNWEEIEESLQRLRFETKFSYIWYYDKRYKLQRLEPGVILNGSLEQLPVVRLFLDLELATYWHLRVEHSYDLAQLDTEPSWRGAVDYTF